jgi:hypothetical protein
MDIELLVVPDCPHQSAAAELIAKAMADTGVKATLTTTLIATEDMAAQRHFTGSPTILLNGSDPFAEPGDRVALACRLYSTADGLRGVPALRDLRQALKRTRHRLVRPLALRSSYGRGVASNCESGVRRRSVSRV